MSNSNTLLRWLCAVLAICLVAGFVSFKFLAPYAAITMVVFICVVLWIISPGLAPPGAGAVKVRLALIFCFAALAMPRHWIGATLSMAAKSLAGIPVIGAAAPWLATLDWSGEASELSLVLATVMAVAISFHLSEKPLAGRDPAPQKKQFPDLPFESRLRHFCSMLSLHLNNIDRELGWSNNYVQLDAEVETSSSIGHPSRRLVNLQTALRDNSEAKVFLLLGDPGGGKSVALRKLASDMFAEVKRGGRVPIYINLREWLPPSDGLRRWSKQTPPTLEQLEVFVISNLRKQGSFVDEEFLEEYFRELWKHGRLFFIFDSFDEIPELLDADENSWLIDQLSDLLSRFIRSHKDARGLLASRMFRRPTHLFAAEKKLEIRPLSEIGIKQAMSHYPGFTEALQKQLLHERPDWLPVVRNPFMMALLGEWVRTHDKLPDTQKELYQHYFSDRLTRAVDHIERHNLTVDDILNSTKQIAGFVFDSGAYGLEAPVSVLQLQSEIPHVKTTIEILRYTLIARVGNGEPASFAFVHRRFLEYLVTTRMLAQPVPPPFQTIQDDSRGRDAMVLYAQLCNDASANELAQRCWTEIEAHFGKPGDRSGIHSLRFLIDAFRSRRDALAAFASALSAFVSEQAKAEDDIVRTKICLEATGLLKNDDAVLVLQMAMSGPNDWLRETAFRACRHLPALSDKLRQSVNSYVINMPARQFWRERAALLLSLALSEPLRSAYSLALWRKRNLIASVAAILIGGALVPELSFIFVLSAGLLAMVDVFFIPLVVAITPQQWRKPNFPFRSTLFAPGALFRLHQHLLAVTLLWLAYKTLLKDESKAMSQFVHASGLLPAHQWPALALLLLVLGLLSLEWILTSYIGHAYRGFMALSRREKIKLLSLILGSWILIPLTIFGLVWLIQLIPASMQQQVSTGMAFVLVALLGIAGLRASLQYARERLALPALLRTISANMSRIQIVNALNTFKLNRHRMAVVAKLAEQKTVASGDWPDGFKLNQRGGPAITELAKLQERWLKLDR